MSSREDLDVVGNYRTNHDVAGRKILAAHVNQVFEDCEGNAFSHIDKRPTGRIPTPPDASGALTVQTSINRPADSKKAPHKSGRNVVLDAGQCLLH
jgi:hypothetical protein